MKNNPLISVITVSYNAENTIERTIQSVLNQKYKNYEYIIIDGNSSDNTIRTIEKYKYGISTLIVESDQGIYDAMNKGLKVSKGRFVNFLNAGDYYYDDNTLLQVANHIKPNTGIVYGKSVLYNDEGYSKLLEVRDISLSTLKKDFYICHQATFVSKTHLNYYNLEYGIKADYKWLIDLYKKIEQKDSVKINEPVVNYLMGGFSAENYWSDLFELLKLHKKEFGTRQILKNIDVYAYRTLRHFKNLVFAKLP